MKRDDYHVIIYKILAYLYTQLKNGDDVDAGMISNDGKLFQINQRYWAYIIHNLLAEGYISGITEQRAWGDVVLISGLEDCIITPKGIAYLCDNSLLAKAKAYLKEIKEIVPFI